MTIVRPGPREIVRAFIELGSVYRVAQKIDVSLGDVESAVHARLVQLERREMKRKVR